MRLSSSSEEIATASTSRSVKSAKFFTEPELFKFRIILNYIALRQIAGSNPNGASAEIRARSRPRGTLAGDVRSSSCRKELPGASMDKVKYRLNDPRLAPRRTKLEIPGWAGKREPRADGSREQVWHCVPFSEGAQYGIELFYPYDNELHVTTRDGKLLLEGDWGPAARRRRAVAAVPKFRRQFLHLPVAARPQGREGHGDPDRTASAVLYRSHRYRADRRSGAGAQLVADGVLTVFKAPAEGGTHIFRPNEPFAQIIVIPEEATFELEPMNEEESAERELQARRIYANRPNLSAGTEWTIVDRNGVRRHLPASPPRRQGEGAPGLSAQQTNRTRMVLLSSSHDAAARSVVAIDGGGDDGGGGDGDGDADDGGTTTMPRAIAVMMVMMVVVVVMINCAS